ncbi:carboxymuconolactone decarboxylase family protein [Dyadobacter sp. LJ53]|uniref:carboxymuconolactone decarboxylase family protein n=1 Tax=Dyadobacter chenwenxiniae TaxID=2906456 RepID=UPI001F2D054F|nr:carboxymuconolactone decarboxylase family protein [Dyadobacter chenwenxiniae]MCF0049241.1 carboxymuconolactone decarboxylase family protein [Dyadobacter chenwenxiniae]
MKTITMSRFKLLSLLIFILSSTAMNAKNKSGGSQALTPQQQSISIIAALTAAGDMEGLSTQLHAGLDAGLTVEETKEILVQLYAYCGFPRSLNAISTMMKVVEKRKASGKNDQQGKAALTGNKPADKYEQGRKVLETLTKTTQTKPAPGFGEFAPRIDAFLKEHLFADIFESEVLTFQQREIVTISALTAMPGVTSQLQAHVKMGTNTGITENQLAEIADLIEKHVSKTQGNTLRTIISKPLTPVIEKDMMVRISEIEIVPEFLAEYNAILKEESSASVEKEPGVLAIFPMSIKEQPNQIRIVEIYAGSAAYQSHLKTPHFQHYKTTTQKMVKALKLVDMHALDSDTMLEIFKKLK